MHKYFLVSSELYVARADIFFSFYLNEIFIFIWQSIACGNNHILLTFDNLITIIAVPNGYNNINWANAYTNNVTTNTSGYYTAAVSPPVVIYDGGGNPMTMTSANSRLITLYYAAAAAAWCNNLQLTVVGYNSNSVIVSNTYTLQVYTVAYITFIGYSGLSSITFSTSGGTSSSNGVCTGPQFAMDNICLSFAWIWQTIFFS